MIINGSIRGGDCTIPVQLNLQPICNQSTTNPQLGINPTKTWNIMTVVVIIGYYHNSYVVLKVVMINNSDIMGWWLYNSSAAQFETNPQRIRNESATNPQLGNNPTETWNIMTAVVIIGY